MVKRLSLVVASLHLIACSSATRTHLPASGDRTCSVLLPTIAAVADTTAPLRIRTLTGTPAFVLEGKDAEDRSIYISLLSKNLGAPDSVIEPFFDPKSALVKPAALPQCEMLPSKTSWHADLPSPQSDTITVTLSLPVFIDGSDPERAVIYGAWLERTGQAPPSLSNGDLASGSLYLLERQRGTWTLVRSLGVWAQLRE
jgi:hypothetical protein